MKAWGECKQCSSTFASAFEFSSHACLGPLPADWHEPVRGKRSYAQWDDATAVLVHVDPKTGDTRYPGRHDAKLKDGYERRFLRSLSEVNKFERDNKVANHCFHFDRNGRDLQDWNGGSH